MIPTIEKIPKEKGRTPTAQELAELWDLMVEADRDSRSDAIYAAQRLVSNRRKTTEAQR